MVMVVLWYARELILSCLSFFLPLLSVVLCMTKGAGNEGWKGDLFFVGKVQVKGG